jgi:hypothetical protein
MSARPNMYRAALWYALHGWHVFPCRERDKRPHTLNGLHAATRDAATIDAWWQPRPQLNLAAEAGRSNLLIVDFDSYDARERFERLLGPLPLTVTSETARGAHYFYQHDHAALRLASSNGKLGEKVDTKGADGYVLLPPSIHPSGKRYMWRPGHGPHEREIAKLPGWLLELLIEKPIERSEPIAIDPSRASAYARAALVRECRDVANAPPGTRNHRLNAAAYSLGTLVGAGVLDAALARGALISAGIECGLRQHEAIATANSGISAGTKQPRQLEERSAAHG